jgi:hypothetical protein
MEQTTTMREQRFAELSDAIEGAQRLAWQLGTRDGISDEARELYSRLEAARLELNALREPTRVSANLNIDPDWVQKFGLVMDAAERLD